MYFNDISKDYKYSFMDAVIILNIIKFENSPKAILYFANNSKKLTNYSYWFILSTLWVSYSGQSDLNLWKKLFSSNVPQKLTSIMKPSELKQFKALPQYITIYRAHRKNETDWIAYTLDSKIALKFAREREVREIKEYLVNKKYVTALFLRRGEKEIICLDKDKAVFKNKILLTD